MHQHYSTDTLQGALDAMLHGRMSQTVASKAVGITQPTVSDYIHHNQDINDRKAGHMPINNR